MFHLFSFVMVAVGMTIACEDILNLFLIIAYTIISENTYSIILTHICRVDPSILINWKSLFPILGASGVLFHFYSISNRYFC